MQKKITLVFLLVFFGFGSFLFYYIFFYAIIHKLFCSWFFFLKKTKVQCSSTPKKILSLSRVFLGYNTAPLPRKDKRYKTAYPLKRQKLEKTLS